jgi:zinc D-Ala-D-Ala carboxypeptidase
MPFKALTEKGKSFIRRTCASDNKLSGKQNYALPYSGLPATTTFTANPSFDGTPITTSQQYGEALIVWFDRYAREYEIDANIIAAQAFRESAFRAWAYSPTGALGISQFIGTTLHSILVLNGDISSSVSPIFTDSEINRIIKDLVRGKEKVAYVVSNSGDNGTLIGRDNRPQLHQNVMDNPDLLIKAQCKYMVGLSSKSDLASVCLFAYNRGTFRRRTYQSTIQEHPDRNTGRLQEGFDYVKAIFDILINEFGYKIDTSFDPFIADISASGVNVSLEDLNRQLSKDFNLRDLLVTDQNLPNIPDREEIERLQALVTNTLQPIRDLAGQRIIVNSAFRSELVNNAVGGAEKSQHRLGQAADIRLDVRNENQLFDLYQNIINSDIPYDQLIYEDKGSTGRRWIHVSYRNDGNNRSQTLTASFPDGPSGRAQYVAFDIDNPNFTPTV